MIAKLKNDETLSITKIQNEERLLLTKIRENPRKFNSKCLEFTTILSETKSGPTIGVQVFKTFSEFQFTDQIQPTNWSKIGHVKCFEHFKLNFDVRRARTGFDCYLQIGKWFGLKFFKIESNFCIHLKQNNGLFDDTSFHSIGERLFLTDRWYKEFSKIIFFNFCLK